MYNFNPGVLVKARNRDWIVQPSPDKDLLLLKPLGGSEEEMTGIYLPLKFSEDQIEASSFPSPVTKDIGDFLTAKILFNATRLSFRNASGPFRSIAKLSFRPRSYQIVPLIMALKLETIKLLIADDVGIGKTIEALLIVKELLERKEIKRFAIVCLPHLCEQWQEELKEKFSIDAVIIRSNTQARLDRDIHGDESVFHHYPYQVISIDYIKSEQRRQLFIQECPELVIVDEAHTCAKPAGASKNQQLRYSLLYDIANKENQNLILLTATPHSGKTEEFNSLLGILKNEFVSLDLPSSSQKERRNLAKHFVQRRRADVVKWMNEDTPFPTRDAGEFSYTLSAKYQEFFNKVLDFARDLVLDKTTKKNKQRMKYWSALALLRGVMSSPSAGVEMLIKRIYNQEIEIEPESEDNPIIEEEFSGQNDLTPIELIAKADWNDPQQKLLSELALDLDSLKNLDNDYKIKETLKIISKWMKDGYNPVIFCRYIATAKYIGELISEPLKKEYKGCDIQVITSEDPDDVRKQRINDMSSASKRLLIATDCLSEGINLQELFTAVLHYDLPWNPNRLEQREGRVDRFGQSADIVKAYLLYGANNPIDGVVLQVLLRKVREIRKSIGISIPFPEDSKTVLDAVLQAVLLKPEQKQLSQQDSLFADYENEIKQNEIMASKEIDAAAEREKQSRSIFAQNAINADEIEEDLKQTDEAIGNPLAVEEFVTSSLKALLGVQIDSFQKGYKLYTTNLPDVLKHSLPLRNEIKVCFNSPVPDGYYYIGRNHNFVEQLCQLLLSKALNGSNMDSPARASVIRCKQVDIKTTIFSFRVRNVIKEKSGVNQLVSEEMFAWGYKGMLNDKNYLSYDETKYFLDNAYPTGAMTNPERISFFEAELENLDGLIQNEFKEIAVQRAETLVESHERFRKAFGSAKFQVVEPVLPMDIIGIYILLPLGGAK